MARTTKPLPLKVAKTHRHSDGTIHALSSDGTTVYTVVIDPASCTCPAGRAGRACYHWRTSKVRYGRPASAGAAGEELLAWAFGEVPAAPHTDPDPEPPTPAAPAARLTCACMIYGPDPSCGCQQPVQEAA